MSKGDKPSKTAKNKGPLDYLPSAAEKRLLDVMLDPYHRFASVTRQCEIAEISRNTFYEMMKREDFMDYYQAITLEAIRHKSGQLVNIGIREANKGSFQHWKTLLEMGKLHTDKKIVTQEGSVEYVVRFADPDEDPEDTDDDD